MLVELDKRIVNEFFVIFSNMADVTFVILLSLEWLQTKNVTHGQMQATFLSFFMYFFLSLFFVFFFHSLNNVFK